MLAVGNPQKRGGDAYVVTIHSNHHRTNWFFNNL